MYFEIWNLETPHAHLREKNQEEAECAMISSKAQEIPPFIVMDVLEKAQELERNGEHIIHLEVGEPDFDTPECISEACYRAI